MDKLQIMVKRNDRERTFTIIKCLFAIILICGSGIWLSAYFFGLPGLYTSGFVISLVALIVLIVLFEDFFKIVWLLLYMLAVISLGIRAITGMFGVIGLCFGLSWKDSTIVALILVVVGFLTALSIKWIINSTSKQNRSSETEGQASVKESEC